MQEPPSGEQGRIGIHVDTASFAVSPGDSVTIPVVLSNHGLEGDVLTLAVDGIPSSWVYTSSASTLLTPGQAQEISLTIQPPHSLQARAGRHPFRIQVTSQSAPGQVFEVACTLTIAAFSEFSSELRPQRVKAGEPARVMVENRGNIQQAYTLTCQSPNDTVSFEPGPSQELRVPPGEVAMAEFSAKPKSRPLFGGEVSFPFTARVQAAEGERRNLNGEVVGKALIPSSVLTVVLVAILVIAAIAVLLAVLGGSPEGGTPPEQPAATATQEVEQPAPTQPPPEQPTEPPPEQPTEPPPEQPAEPPAEEPPAAENLPAEPSEGGLPCAPAAAGLMLAPLLVASRKRRSRR